MMSAPRESVGVRTELFPRVAELIEVARDVTPGDERDGAESAPDRIFRFYNRQTDGLQFKEMAADLEAAVAHERRRLNAARPERDDARRSHGRLVVTLAQFHLQLGHVDQGIQTLGFLRGATRSTNLASKIASLEDVIGFRTADDAMTTCVRLKEKGRSPSEFRHEETMSILKDAERGLKADRNRSKLYWRRYVVDALGEQRYDRARYEKKYLELTPGGATPGMNEASLKGTLIYDYCLAGDPEAALEVTKGTRALIMPLWNGLGLLPRMTSHMILCHLRLVLNVIAEVASLRGATSIQEECEGWIASIGYDMTDLWITEKADGFWEAEAVFAAMPRRREVGKVLQKPKKYKELREVITHYDGIVERLTHECDARPASRFDTVPHLSVFSDGLQ
jgi:hypothetical protein